MGSRQWRRGIRLCAGFLLAPAVVPLTLHSSLHLVAASAHLNVSDLAASTLGVFMLTCGVGLVYLCVLCLGVPYVVLMQQAGRLNFRAIMLPTLMLSWVYSVVVYFSLQKDYPRAGTIAVLCVPGVLLAGLCFYFIAVWRSQEDAEASLLLETYSAREKPTLQT